MWGKPYRAFLEDLAIAAGQLAKLTRRHARRTMKRTYEVGQITKTNFKSNIRDRTILICQQARGSAQSRAHEILMRRNAEHARKHAQKVERAELGHTGRLIEIDRLIDMRIQPKRRLDRTAPITLVSE